MFCSKCGNKLEEESEFCPKCGAKQDAKSEIKQEVKSEVKSEVKPEVRSEVKSSYGNKKVVNILNVVAGALLLIVGFIDIQWDWGLIALASGIGILVSGIIGLVNQYSKARLMVELVFGGITLVVGFMCASGFDWTYIGIGIGATMLISGILKVVGKFGKPVGITNIVFGAILIFMGVACISYDFGLISLIAGVLYLVVGIISVTSKSI